MRPFTFIVPDNVAQARAALREHGEDAALLAGGQTLLLEMKARLRSPPAVLHVGALEALRGWSYENGTLALGSATSYASLEDGDSLRGAHELIRQVAGDLADRAVRNLGTVGGAVSAAVPAFDIPSVLLALDARLVLRSTDAERELTVDQFVRGEGSTARRPDELLEAIMLPPREEWQWAFEKFRHRLVDPAMASVAVLARLDEGGRLGDSRVVLGSVAETPVRLQAVEEQLCGLQVDRVAIDQAGSLAAELAGQRARASLPCSHEYVMELVATLTRRALRRAVRSAAGGEA